ncbi:MAG: GDSL-type esterase/lipase family protein [Rubrivivax sp.]|nr:GDSL-type esterase/lipase family protein [Rubrivivax sp.]
MARPSRLSRPRRPGSHGGPWLLGAAALLLLVTGGCAVSRLKTSADLVKQSQPFQARPAAPERRLLIVGDSTAVGTGASRPEASLAGLISREQPRWLIVNRAQDGAKFADIADQLQGSERFDLVLVMGGGNDVIRFTSGSALRANIDRTAARAAALAPQVVLMPAGNVGNAPFFFAPWSWWMSARARDMHDAVRAAAARHGATYVRLYKEPQDDPFVQQADRLHAADKLHPSDDGYSAWFAELRRQAPQMVGGVAR